MKENKCSKKKKIVWLLAILTFVIAIFATSGIQQKQDSFTETNKTVLNLKSEKKSPESTIHSNGGNPGRSTDNESSTPDVIKEDVEKQSPNELGSSFQTPSFPQAAQPSKKPEQPDTTGTHQQSVVQPIQTSVPTVPETPVHVHDWQPIERVIHHDEVTHTVHHDAVTQSIYIVDSPRETHDVIRCLVCGAEYLTTDEWMLQCASAQDHGNYTVVTIEDHSEQGHYEEQVIQSAYDETVIDSSAWDETVIDGYRCNTCGKLK